jgi:hypothetical protein
LPLGVKLKTKILFREFKDKHKDHYISEWTDKNFKWHLVRLAEFEGLDCTFEQLDGVEWFMLGKPRIFLGSF